MRNAFYRKLLTVCGFMAGVVGILLMLLPPTTASSSEVSGVVALFLGWAAMCALAVSKRTPDRETKLLREELKAHDERQRDRTHRLEAAIEAERAKESRHEYVQERALERIESRIREANVLPRAYGGQGRSSDVLFVTSNGAGLGHLTRLLAVAERMGDEYSVEFLTLSRAYAQVSVLGYPIRYFPSAEVASVDNRQWNLRFRQYLQELFSRGAPKVVVFDGTVVYEGLVDVCRGNGTPLIWMQRGCWKPAADKRYPERRNAAKVADQVIIPSDYAVTERIHVGPGIKSATVAPIVLLSPEMLLSASEAKKALSLSSRGKHILFNVGGNAPSDPTSHLSALRRTVQEYSPRATITLVRSPLDADADLPNDINVIRKYPVAKYARAFDFVVAAAGYNTVQEAASLGVPTVFVPNLDTQTDDQLRRASAAASDGWAKLAHNPDELSEIARRLLTDDSQLVALSRGLASLAPTDGAEHAAKIVASAVAQSEWYEASDYMAPSGGDGY